jgi:hypothetical protein
MHAKRCEPRAPAGGHRLWSDLMRGAAVLIAYLLGLGAIISFGIAGLMALQSPTAIRTSSRGRAV